MKKIIMFISLALCLGLLAACSPAEVLDGVAEELHEANEQRADADGPAEDGEPAGDGGQAAEDASESDAATVPEPADEAPEEVSGSDAASAEDAPQSALPEEAPAPDPAALTIADCVTDADGAPGQLPRVTLDCEGAASINEDIEGTFRYLIGEDYAHLAYECFINDGVLSILITEDFETDSRFYTPYNLDLVTGRRMDGAALMTFKGVDADTLIAAELRIMGEEFDRLNADVPLTAEWMEDFTQEQRARTVAPENAETERIWLDEDGSLYFVAKLYALAGAELYEHPMDSGF